MLTSSCCSQTQSICVSFFVKGKEAHPLNSEEEVVGENVRSIIDMKCVFCFPHGSWFLVICCSFRLSLWTKSRRICQKQRDSVSELDVRMGHTSLCVLGFFLLNMLLYCGHAQDCVLSIEPNWSTFFTGESVTFICDTREGEVTGWYKINKDGHMFSNYNRNKNFTSPPLATGHSGEYQCSADHGGSRKESNKVSLTVSDKNVILESPASTLYEGESVTLRCRHRNRTEEKNAAFYRDGSLIEMDTNRQSQITSTNTAEMTVQLLSDGSSYMCKFDDDDEESEPIKLKVEPQRPKAKLSKDKAVIPAGGSVTLTCSVSSPSSGWTFFWYRSNKTSEPLTTQDVVVLSDGKISVPQGGVYWCRGGRGNPVYYTEYSDAIVTNRAVVTLQPNWPEMYSGETITLTCDIEDGGDTEWEYKWSPTRPYKKTNRYVIKSASSSDSGDYRCMGKTKSGKASTEWSDAFRLTVSYNIPQPVLTVSPSWLSPGDSVTLNCSVKEPSAGWRFYWYKAVPKLSDSKTSSSYELLPDSSRGTEQDSYTVHGQTYTAGYACRAGRGDPVYYTSDSEAKFVWSGDSHSAASLTVSPDSVQHFTENSVSLRCEGNSTKWRVSRISDSGHLTHCSSWGTMTGTTCTIHASEYLNGVYWCESETGLFSSAVNITRQYSNMILVSPVHPVAEGGSVTLGCRLRTENVLSNVDFYKNGKLIQNGTSRELTIPAVSKTDEGFYKCEGKGGWSWTSAESWMSVKLPGPQSSPFPVLLIVGLVCGVLLIIVLLLLLYCYRKKKDSCCIRSQSTNQGSATDHMINQDDTQCKEYASPSHDDACLYESIKGPEEPEHDESSDVTYSLIELKNIAKKGKNTEPEEISVYSDVKIGSAAGKSSPAAADESVYSEVKPGAALDQ